MIVWKDVRFNPDGHYSSDTGAYTCPQDGYYQFTVMKMTTGLYSHSTLLVDGVGTYAIMDHSHTLWKQHGGTVILKLKAGSKVQVRSWGSTELRGFGVWPKPTQISNRGIYSWFSGHLLFPA